MAPQLAPRRRNSGRRSGLSCPQGTTRRVRLSCACSAVGVMPRNRSVPVDRARVAPQAILLQVFGLEVPGVGFDKHHAAADIQHDTADLAVAGAQARVLTRVGIAGAIVVTITRIIWHSPRLPHHEGVLPKCGLGITSRRKGAVSANRPVLDVSGQLVRARLPVRSVGKVERTPENGYVLDILPKQAALATRSIRIADRALVG